MLGQTVNPLYAGTKALISQLDFTRQERAVKTDAVSGGRLRQVPLNRGRVIKDGAVFGVRTGSG